MATGGGDDWRKDERDFRHCCSLCLEPYKGRTPKILPCFHTFCLPCLTALQANLAATSSQAQGQQGQSQGEDRPTESQDQENAAENSQEGKGDDDVTCGGDDVVSQSDAFLCPTCRAPVTIPEGGMSALQTNFYLDFEEDENVVPCDMCEATNQQPATHACQQCQLRICTACRRYHDMLQRGHQITSVNRSQPEKKKEEKKNCCLVHQDQPLCFHCRRCDVSICLHCKVTSHEGHATVDLAHAALESREEVTSLVTTAQGQLQVVESAARRLDRDDRELARYTQEVRQLIHARRDAMITWVHSACDQLLDDVTAKEEEVKGQLLSEKTAAVAAVETLSGLVSRAARGGMANDHDAVWLRKELKAALLGEDRLSRHRQTTDRDHQSPAWNWSYDVSDSDVISRELLVAYMGRVKDDSADDVKTKLLSLREVSERLDRLYTEVTETTGTLETQLDNVKDDLQKKTASLDKDVIQLKKNEADLWKKTASLNDEMTASKTKIADLDKNTSSLQQDLVSLKTTTTMSSLEKKFGKAGKMFSVSLMDKSKTNINNKVIFKDVKVNHDNCFNLETGMFTAPVSGTYAFTARAEASCDSRTATLRLDVTGDYWSCKRVIEGGYSGKEETCITDLRSGQCAYVTALSTIGDYDSYQIRFFGWLLQEHQ